MLPSILAKEIIKGLQAYVVTGFETPTPFFKGVFRNLVQTPGRFYKGPYLGLDLPFQSGDAGTVFFAGLTTEHPPWLHQQQAWQRLASDREAASTLIATGTGSGKTECFLYPLLDHCVRAVRVFPAMQPVRQTGHRTASSGDMWRSSVWTRCLLPYSLSWISACYSSA